MKVNFITTLHRTCLIVLKRNFVDPKFNIKTEIESLKRQLVSLEKFDVKRRKMNKQRVFDFSKYRKRYIALKFSYFGWDYCGLQVQDNTNNTVLHEMFEALMSAKLIPDRNSAQMKICGRTDKGVSGLEQIISVVVRSTLKYGHGIDLESGENIGNRKDNCDEEIDYAFILNKILPKNITVTGWAPVDAEFSARYDCRSRSYRYYFPRSDLNIEAMERAAQNLIGEKDFRNFCTMTVNQGRFEYIREIKNASIHLFEKSTKSEREDILYFQIQASGFIYHQIRYTVSVLFMIGQGLEDEGIIDKLLDVEGIGREGKPSYSMAADLPLIFYEACYEDIKWKVSDEAQKYIILNLQQQWVESKMKETIARQCLESALANGVPSEYNDNYIRCLSREVSTQKSPWRPVMDRIKEPSLQMRIEQAENSHVDSD